MLDVCCLKLGVRRERLEDVRGKGEQGGVKGDDELQEHNDSDLLFRLPHGL